MMKASTTRHRPIGSCAARNGIHEQRELGERQGQWDRAFMSSAGLIFAAMIFGCTATTTDLGPATDRAICPTTDGPPGDFSCTPATNFAGRTATTLLVSDSDFHQYYDLFLQAVTAEPLLGGTKVNVPYKLDGRMRTSDKAIGQAWAQESFRTPSVAFNELVTTLKMTPDPVRTYQAQVEGTVQVYTINPYVTVATPMYSNKLVGEAFAAMGVALQREANNQFPDDSTWTWTGASQAKIDIAAIVGNCFDSCGIHYFQADVSLTGATVRDMGGFIPVGGLALAPSTIRQPI